MIDFENGSFFKLKQNDEYAAKVAQLLLPDEKVISAFKAVRDGAVFTDKRIIVVNVQGITGRKIDYTSLPYSKITASRLKLPAPSIWIPSLRCTFQG